MLFRDRVRVDIYPENHYKTQTVSVSAMLLDPRNIGIYVNHCVLDVLKEENKKISLYYATYKDEITPLFRFIFCA